MRTDFLTNQIAELIPMSNTPETKIQQLEATLANLLQINERMTQANHTTHRLGQSEQPFNDGYHYGFQSGLSQEKHALTILLRIIKKEA